MAIGYQERVNDPMVALQVAMRSGAAGIWTALPGIVQSFDPAAVTVTVQPAIQGVVTRPDGSVVAVNLPLLPDVPVVFPRGGGATLTFPVAAGDECLVVFASRCIDAWWQSGGVQIPMESRMHDLSDGFALVGPMSQAKKISGISTSAVQLRSDDGAAFVEINPASHAVNVQTSGNISATAGGNASVTASGAISLTAPTITLTGAIQLNGPITQGSGAGGTSASLIGPLTVTNDVTAAGTSVHGHTHPEHDGGNTGAPN